MHAPSLRTGLYHCTSPVSIGPCVANIFVPLGTKAGEKADLNWQLKGNKR